jgi:hypothetical protein
VKVGRKEGRLNWYKKSPGVAVKGMNEYLLLVFSSFYFLPSQCIYYYIFIYISLWFINDAVSILDYIPSNDAIILMNWKEYGRRRSWPKLRQYRGIYLEGLRKTTKNIRQAAGHQSKI